MNPHAQSAVIPVRRIDGRLEILMVTSASGRRWVIPKGIIEDDLTPQESARKEAIEEAGVTGKVHADLLGGYAYDKWGGTCRVKVYLMVVEEILDEWPERSLRRREWIDPAEASARVREPDLRRIIQDLPETVERLGLL